MKDVPTSSQLKLAGKRLLFSAWQELSKLSLNLRYHSENDWYEEETLDPKQYWEMHHHLLESTLVLILNASELLIKARISAISPFLILKDSTKFKRGKSFLDAETVSANKIIGVLEVVGREPLSKTLKNVYDDLRRKRNRVIHLGISGEKLEANDLLKKILLIHHALSDESWIQTYNLLAAVPKDPTHGGHQPETLAHLEFFPNSIELLAHDLREITQQAATPCPRGCLAL